MQIVEINGVALSNSLISDHQANQIIYTQHAM